MDKSHHRDFGVIASAMVAWCFATGAGAQPSLDRQAHSSAPLCKDLNVLGPDMTVPVSLGPADRSAPPAGVETYAAVGSVMLRRERRMMTDLVTSISGPFTFRGGKGRSLFDVVVPDGPLVPFRNEVQQVYVSPGARVNYRIRTGPQPIGIYFLVPIDDRSKLISHIYWGNAAEDHVISDAKIGHTVCAEGGPIGVSQELVFAKATGNLLSLTYREIADDAGRVITEQSLTHDLTTGATVAIRGSVIRVVKVTEAGVSFIVEKPFPTLQPL